MTRAIAVTLAVLILLMGAYVKGRHDEALAATARAYAAQTKAHAAEQSRHRGALKLEDAANADPVSVPTCLSADRVRRLSLR